MASQLNHQAKRVSVGYSDFFEKTIVYASPSFADW
jgi:hypothetical protein